MLTARVLLQGLANERQQHEIEVADQMEQLAHYKKKVRTSAGTRALAVAYHLNDRFIMKLHTECCTLGICHTAYIA